MKIKFVFVVFLIIFTCSIVQVFAQQKTYLITDFGAIADGKTINTVAIQKAIDMAEANGGGKVVCSKGNFVTGVIYLKTGVELHIEEGGLIMGSNNRLDYGTVDAAALICAKNKNNISITGKGIIDGRGRELVIDIYRLLKSGVLKDEQWPAKRPSEKTRPKLISFIQCTDVKVKGVTIKNGCSWIQNYERCNNVIIDSITVLSNEYWNNDGVDIVNSKNVSITNCNINVADDAICLKSEGEVLDSCVNIYVANCTLRSSANAFKIGTGSKGGFRNIKVRNLNIFDTYRAAIALETVDGAFLENVDIKNIHAENTGCAIFIKLGHRNKDSAYSSINNIRIANVYVVVPGTKPDKGYPMEGPGLKYPPGFKPTANGINQSISPYINTDTDSTAIPYLHNAFPSSITGLPSHPLKNIILENIEIAYEGAANKNIAFFPLDSLNTITEAYNSYPEFSMFGELPCWGIYVRHGEGITFNNVKLSVKHPDFRIALLIDDVKKLVLNTIQISAPAKNTQIGLNKVLKPVFKKVPVNAAGENNIIFINK